MKILLCSDGHCPAEQAIRFVADFASAWEPAAVLLGIVERESDGPALQAALDEEAAILRERKVPVQVMTRAGEPIEEIRRHMTEEKYDLVAIGTVRKEGPAGLSRKAYDLVRELEVPVMIVPESEKRRPLGEGAQILMCSGGSQHFAPLVAVAIKLAGKAKLPVTILHVHPTAPALFSNLLEWEMEPKRLLASRSALARNLRQEREDLRAAGIEATVTMRFGAIAPEIMEEARSGKYVLIAMGAAPAQGPVRQYVMGDVAAAVLNEIETPVVILKTGVEQRVWWRRLFAGRSGGGPQ